MSPTTSRPPAELSIYLLSGVYTAPTFMEPLRRELHALCVARLGEGVAVRSCLLHPYGDWSRSLLRQLNEVRADLFRIVRPTHRSIGGCAAVDAIRAAPPTGKLLLVGHSGGGVAAVHAAELLMREDGVAAERLSVVQIGSPKCRVPQELRERTLFITAVRTGGRVPAWADPVTRLGGWGGWTVSPFGLPRRLGRKHAPAHVAKVPIVGWHPDYFRDAAPYVDDAGEHNLAKIAHTIMRWIDLPASFD